MKITAKPNDMTAAINMMRQPKHKTAVIRLLKIKPDQYEHLYEMFQYGCIDYYNGKNKIRVRIDQEEHNLIKGFDLSGFPEKRYPLPRYIVQDFSDETVGNYKKEKQK